MNRSQLKILILIAQEATELTGKKSMRILNLSSSSILKALKQLEAMDYIEKFEDRKITYEAINPVVKCTKI